MSSRMCNAMAASWIAAAFFVQPDDRRGMVALAVALICTSAIVRAIERLREKVLS